MSTQPTDNSAPIDAATEHSVFTERRNKLAAIRQAGVAFPNEFRPTHKCADLQTQYNGFSREELEEKNENIRKSAIKKNQSKVGKKKKGEETTCGIFGCNIFFE